MKVVDMLYQKIDELNTCIKMETDMDNKYKCAREIGKVIEAIEVLRDIKEDLICPDSNQYI